MKKIGRYLWIMAAGLVLGITLFLGASPVSAASKKPKIKSVDYEGNGRVEVEFKRDVEYGKTKVTVKDTSGKKYKVSIIEKDDDDIIFVVKKAKAGKTYNFTITKVRREYTSKYYKVKGKFKIPKNSKVTVKEVDYDAEDQDVEFEFKKDVKWKNPKVTITEEGGTADCVTSIKEHDEDGIEVNVKGMTRGKTYKYKITGVAPAGTKKWKTVEGTFVA